ncbi:c-type cytochrome [Pedobacter immunditicola]|uniref:c-type cytochrome n=1 Tax=Pedobacter immunditicola TaxID=3133440 RepID=UPI0030A0E440
MKKIMLILGCFTLAMASCGNDASKSTEESTTTTTTTESTAPAPTEAMLPGEKLIAKSDCIGCHNKTQKVIGPSYVDIAAKYTEKDVDYLADKIISGGKGVWGEVAMTPHPTTPPDDAKEMVRYILTLKK